MVDQQGPGSAAAQTALIQRTRSVVEQFKVKERRLEAQVAGMQRELEQKNNEIARLRSILAEGDHHHCHSIQNARPEETSLPQKAKSNSAAAMPRSEYATTDLTSSPNTNESPAIVPQEMLTRHTRLGLYGSTSFALNVVLVGILVAIQDMNLLSTTAVADLTTKTLGRVQRSAWERRAYAVLRGWDEAFEAVRGREATTSDDAARDGAVGDTQPDQRRAVEDVVRADDVQVLASLAKELLCGAGANTEVGLCQRRQAIADTEQEQARQRAARTEGRGGEGGGGGVAGFSSPFAVLLSSTLASLDFDVIQHTAFQNGHAWQEYLSALASDPHEQDKHRAFMLEELLDLLPALELHLSDWGVNGRWMRGERRELARKAEEAAHRQ